MLVYVLLLNQLSIK